MNKSVIQNGLNPDLYTFIDRKPGFELAFMGEIGHKKGNMLLIQLLANLVKIDSRYRLSIAGQIYEMRFDLYIENFVKENGLENNIRHVGFVTDKNEFFKDKQYIICTSPWEGQNISVMEGMLCGLKPVIHNFPGSKQVYSERYIWNTVDEAIAMIKSDNYCSLEYRELVESRYNQKQQVEKTGMILDKLTKEIYEIA
ncbi:MAG: glycosyltransferase [Smithella sp.]|nr:glycosyltransferase [Smithella sp.]